MLPLTTTLVVLLSSSGLVRGLAVDNNSPSARHEARTFGGKKWPVIPWPLPVCLNPKAWQSASRYTGLEEGTPGIRPGLSESAT